MNLATSLRRLIDIGAAVTGLLISSPIFVIAAAATRLTAGRGVIYRQRRLGRGGHPFELLKFRSMRHPKPGNEGPAHDGNRLTRVGRFLRATSIDELPSFWNLLRGDITMVGPRPLPVHYWERFRGEEYRRFEVKPGITGLAQINGRNAIDWDRRLALDVAYVKSRGFRGDMRILFRTVPTVLGSSGVDQAPGVTMTELPRDRPHPVQASKSR